MVNLDIVKIDDTFRLCYAQTSTPALVAENNPVDMFETVLDPDSSAQLRIKWLLQRRAATKSPGYRTRGAAERARKMIQEAGIEILEMVE